MQRCHGLLLVSALTLVTNVSFAAPKTPQPTTQAPKDGTHEADLTEAERLFSEAKERYVARDFEGALTHLRRCYELSGDENLLFNIAQLQRELSHCPEALEYYEKYVNLSKTGERTEDANRYIAELRAQCPAPPTTQAPAKPAPEVLPALLPQPATMTSPPVPRKENNPWPTVGWVSVGAGAVSLAAGTFFAVSALNAKKDTEKASIDAAYYEERNNDLFRNSVFAGAFGATALVATGLSIYSFAIAAPQERSQATAFTVGIQPGTVLIGARGGF